MRTYPLFLIFCACGPVSVAPNSRPRHVHVATFDPGGSATYNPPAPNGGRTPLNTGPGLFNPCTTADCLQNEVDIHDTEVTDPPAEEEVSSAVDDTPRDETHLEWDHETQMWVELYVHHYENRELLHQTHELSVTDNRLQIEAESADPLHGTGYRKNDDVVNGP